MNKREKLVYNNAIKNNELIDVCYKCGTIQEMNTMSDLNMFEFDIYCNECIKKETK